MCVCARLYDPDGAKIINVDDGLHFLPKVFAINVSVNMRERRMWQRHTDPQIHTSSVVKYRHVDCEMKWEEGTDVTHMLSHWHRPLSQATATSVYFLFLYTQTPLRAKVLFLFTVRASFILKVTCV